MYKHAKNYNAAILKGLNGETREPVIREGQECRKCGLPVKTERHAIGWKPRPGQQYCFDWWLRCTNGKYNVIYLVEAAKRFL